ncbi:MAG: acyltransferase domain-containing protein, partial [Halieaceae bacterium]
RAVVVGMQLNLTPPMQIFLSRTQSFSPTGRCRAFDADSDGFVLGEGVGVVILGRSADNGGSLSPPRARLLNCGVNHDGPASGLTVPNQNAQESLIRDVLKRSKRSPDDVNYVETHGTGTQLGDPIEVSGLRGIFGSRTEKNPLMIGSVKANIGHLSAAAGMASVIKAILMLEENKIFPQINFKEPNPKIPWEGFSVNVSTALQDLAPENATPLIGVSSFGLSGTNAHVLLESAGSPAASSNDSNDMPFVLAVCASDLPALTRLLESHATQVQDLNDSSRLHAYCALNNLGRQGFSNRLLISGRSKEELVEQLRKHAAEIIDASPRARSRASNVAFSLVGRPENEFASKERLQQLLCTTQGERGSGPPAERADKISDTSTIMLLSLWRRLGIEPDLLIINETSRDSLRSFVSKTEGDEQNVLEDSEALIASAFDLSDGDFYRLKVELDRQKVGTLVLLTEDDRFTGELQHQNICAFNASSDLWDWLLPALRTLYESGQHIDWSGIYQPPHRRVPIPSYPFATTRYWLDNTMREATPGVTKDKAPVSGEPMDPSASLHGLFSEQWKALGEQAARIADTQFAALRDRLSPMVTGPEEGDSSTESYACGSWRLTLVKSSNLTDLTAQLKTGILGSYQNEELAELISQTTGIDPIKPVGAAVIRETDDLAGRPKDASRKEQSPRFLNMQSDRKLAMMFAGVGDQYHNMGFGLYTSNDAFRGAFDRCASHLETRLDLDIRSKLFTGPQNVSESGPVIDLRAMLGRPGTSVPALAAPMDELASTEVVQPLMFAFGYALAMMWKRIGISPDLLIGYSVGEYVAACLAGIFSPEDAVETVARRARWIAELPRGGLLAVPLNHSECSDLLGDGVFIGIATAQKQTILSGDLDALRKVQDVLKDRKIVARELPGDHAYHSPLLEPVCRPLEEWLASLSLQAPQVPVVSNLSGEPLTDAEARDPRYWSKHTCSTVKFNDGLDYLLQQTNVDFLEVGPGRSLGSFIMQHPKFSSVSANHVLNSLRGRWENSPDEKVFLDTLGILDLLGHRQGNVD